MDRILEDFSILLARIPNNSLEIMGIFNKRNLFAVWELSSLQWWWCLVRRHPVLWFFSHWKCLPFHLSGKSNFYQTHYFRHFFLPILRHAHCVWQRASKNSSCNTKFVKVRVTIGVWEMRDKTGLAPPICFHVLTRLHCFVKKHHIHTNTQIHFTFQLFQSWEHSY